MATYDWCKRKVFVLTEPNKELTQAYLKKAHTALEELNRVKSEEWRVSIAYYAMYFSAYSLLVRVGVKSQNHDCTIKLVEEFIDAKPLNKAHKLRVKTQYYDNPNPEAEEMIQEAPLFVAKCKARSITENEQKKVREEIS